MLQAISHDQYLSNEIIANENVGFFVSEVFSNAYFKWKGRGTAEHSNKSFWKYIDAHHDDRNHFIRNTLLQDKLDELEFVVLEKLLSNLASFCLNNSIDFNTNNAAVLRALYQHRLLRRICNGQISSKTIYEIGPGSGYLSALLALSGNKVISIENTQSHYVFQSFLFNHIFADRFEECAHDTDLLFNPKRKDAALIHIPWWKIATLSGALEQIDILTSNHMILECSDWCMSFYVAMASKLLAADGVWLLEGTGAPHPGGPSLDGFKRKVTAAGLAFFDISDLVDSKHEFYAVSRNKRPTLVRLENHIPFDQEYFQTKYSYSSDANPNRLSNAQFVKIASIDHS